MCTFASFGFDVIVYLYYFSFTADVLPLLF